MTNSRIERIYLHCLENFLLLEQPKFNQCFSNLKELACDDNISSGLFHLLAQTTDRIEILGLEFYNYKSNMGLVDLIKAQKHIKKLSCFTSNDSIPKLIKEALLLHANNLVEYTSIGCCDLDYSLSDFKSLKSLNMQRCSLVNDFDDIFDENLKLNLLEKINVSIEGQDCVYTLSKFFQLNGKNLKVIQFDGYLNDPEFLEEFIGSIAQNCPNLEYLSLIYDSYVIKDLCKVFNTCTKLKGLSVKKIDIQPTFEDLFGALITTLPQQIKILSFRQKWLLLDDVLEMFFKKWTGYTPIHIELFNGCEEMIDDDIDNEVKMIELLTQYKEKGLLNFNFFDSIAKFDIFLESL
ncbi:12524_t:CDS:1 [Entrophospora sp. SA101]|nr:12524_t:CDS:1 [Entrophospora sp. SA101]